jgi:hypothetical protein
MTASLPLLPSSVQAWAIGGIDLAQVVADDVHFAASSAFVTALIAVDQCDARILRANGTDHVRPEPRGYG